MIRYERYLRICSKSTTIQRRSSVFFSLGLLVGLTPLRKQKYKSGGTCRRNDELNAHSY